MNRMAISRRHILRALGLAGGASLLPSLRSRSAWTQTPAIPKRLVLFYTMHGSIHNQWVPVGIGGAAPAEKAWALGPIHQPLAGWESKLTFLDGLNMVSADIQDYSPNPENAHIYGQCHSLTGITMASGSLAGGISIDQKIAKDLGPVTFRPSLNLRVGSPDTGTSINAQFAAASQMLQQDTYPADTYKYLFPNGAPAPTGTTPPPTTTPPPVDHTNDQQKSVLDLVAGEFAAIGPKLSAADKLKLDAHASAIRDLETRLSLSTPMPPTSTPTTPTGTTRTCTPIDAAALNGVARSYPQTSGGNEGTGFEQWYTSTADLFMRVIQTAFSCDLTRVVVIMLGQFPDTACGFTQAFGSQIGTGAGLHGLLHKVDGGDGGIPNNDATLTAQALDIAKKYHIYGSTQYAKLLNYLNTIPESDGQSMLDHSAVLYCGEIAAGFHGLHGLPWLLAGSAGGTFRTGRYLKYSNVPHNNLMVSLANAMGSPMTTFGNPSACTGALSGLV
jgi:hypothetical protein